MLLENITMTDFQKGLKKTKTLIIPFGTVEEHGSHLPLSTDTMQVYEVVKEAAKRVSVFIAPPVHYGVLTSTRDHAGSIGRIGKYSADVDTGYHQISIQQRFAELYPHIRPCWKYPHVRIEGGWRGAYR